MEVNEEGVPDINWIRRRLAGPQNWSERCGVQNIFLLMTGIEPRLLGRPARSLLLYQLSSISWRVQIINYEMDMWMGKYT
jgi:hypothetical protein